MSPIKSLSFQPVLLFAQPLALALLLVVLFSAPVVARNGDTLPVTSTAFAPVAVATPLPECSPEWRSVPIPNATIYRQLVAVSAISEADVWAVGSYYTAITFATHWDGLSWSAAPTPNFETGHTVFTGVAAVASNDVWAVGYNHPDPAGYPHAPLIAHWDGATWEMVATPEVPDAGPGGSMLNAVAAVSSSDIWAVGSYIDGNDVYRPLTVRWDGTEWSVVPSPDTPLSNTGLSAIAAISENDVWAVGSLYNADLQRGETLSIHWDGVAWEVIPTPHVGASEDDNSLSSVAGTGPNDVWAVGSIFHNPFSSTTSTLIMKWDGTEWSVVSSPSPGKQWNSLNGVTALTPQDVWAVGYYGAGAIGSYHMVTLIEKWDGSAWNVVASPNPGSQANFLFGVTSLPGRTVWAVGRVDYGSVPPQALTEQYTEQIFADVPPTNTFFPYVKCLACREIDTGYTCGGEGEPCDPFNSPYFRPDTLITRDDLCHMVAGAAGFNEPPGEQRFEDVPTTHPYFAWINRMAVRGLIGGYPCGSPGEPCVPPLNRAYFRPSNHATRGQIAKIVSNGAGLTDIPVGQLFEDVPPSHTFYVWVQRLATREVMGGYECGQNENEPCGPESKPYFRWGSDSTRGQVAKITSNTFFPNCQVLGGR